MYSRRHNDGHVFIDHYQVLGLTIEATRLQIKSRFRLLAKKYHPDLNGGDGMQFLRIYDAYRVLSDNDRRNRYNAGYLQFIRSQNRVNILNGVSFMEISAGRLIYPGNMAVLARRGLLRREIRSRDRQFFLNVNYDVELPLTSKEMNQTVRVSLPLIARTLCPDCRGSDVHCESCGGKGSYKSTRMVRLLLEGGLLEGQILEIQLDQFRLEELAHFKKRKIRIKISQLKEKTLKGAAYRPISGVRG